MSNKPVVTVVIRTKNRPLFLARALESIQQQTLKEWVGVVVNDGGDKTAVENVTSPLERAGKLKVIHFDKSLGRSHTANTAVEASNTPYIAKLDDDDTWEPMFLEKCISRLEHTNSSYQGIVTYANRVEEKLESGKIKIVGKKPYAIQPKAITLSQLLVNNQFTNNSFVYRKAAFEAINGYDESIDVFEDWDFNIRFLERFDVVLIPEMLANYHFRNEERGTAASNTLPDTLDKEALVAHFKDRYLKEDLKFERVGKGVLMFLADKIPNEISLLTMFKKDFSKLYHFLKRKL